MGPSTVSFAEQLLYKLGAALLFAIVLAMVTNASLVQGLRFISAICLLTSSWHFGVALVRRVPFKSTRRPRSVLSASDNPIESRAFGELRTVVNVVARSAYGIAWTTNS